MDFSFSETQQAVAGLAAQVFTAESTVERVKEVERSDDRFDRRLWASLVAAGLLALPVLEEAGGSGLGVTELGLVLEQQGRRVAHVPLLWTALAAMTIAEFAPGRPLAAVLEGRETLSIALATPGAGDPMRPGVTAVSGGDGAWSLTGTVVSVPFGHVAASILVACAAGDDLLLVAIDPQAPGVSTQRAVTTNLEIVTHLELDAVTVGAADVIAGPERGAQAVRWAYERLLTGLAALQVGVAEEALAQAAAYTSTREQFGKPLSSFQSTSARAADAYIDTEAMRATLWQAAWRLDSGLNATTEVEVAKWWASEAGQRVVHAVQHLHGGIGADVEYPVHRYFLWGKQIEDTLGGGSAHLARIADALAAT